MLFLSHYKSVKIINIAVIDIPVVPGALNNQISNNQRNPPAPSSSPALESIPPMSVPSAAESASQIEAMKPPIVDLRWVYRVVVIYTQLVIKMY